jgi:hypothetical protein
MICGFADGWVSRCVLLFDLTSAGAGEGEAFYKGTDVVTLTDGNFEEEVLNSDDIWFVEVGLGWFELRVLVRVLKAEGLRRCGRSSCLVNLASAGAAQACVCGFRLHTQAACSWVPTSCDAAHVPLMCVFGSCPPCACAVLRPLVWPLQGTQACLDRRGNSDAGQGESSRHGPS